MHGQRLKPAFQRTERDGFGADELVHMGDKTLRDRNLLGFRSTSAEDRQAVSVSLCGIDQGLRVSKRLVVEVGRPLGSALDHFEAVERGRDDRRGTLSALQGLGVRPHGKMGAAGAQVGDVPLPERGHPSPTSRVPAASP